MLKTIDYKNLSNYLILAFAFLLPLSKGAISLLSVLLLLCWLLDGKFREKFDLILANKFIIAILVFVLFSCISIIWSNDKTFALDYLRKYMYILLIPVIYTLFEKKYFNKLLLFFLAGMFISTILGHCIYFEILNRDDFSGFPASPFMDHSNYSIYLAFSLFIVIYLFPKNNKTLQFILILFACAFLSNLFINSGRTGQVALVVTAFLFTIFKTKNKLRNSVILIFSSMCLLYVAYNVSPPFKWRTDYLIRDVSTMITDAKFDKSFSSRVSLWVIASNQFLQNPMIGTGIGDELINSKEFIDKYKISNPIVESAKTNFVDFHNAFFHYAAQLGVIGLLLYISIYLYLYAFKFVEKNVEGLHFCFVTFCILFSFTGVNLRYRFSLMFLILFSATFSTMREKVKNKTLK